MPLKSSWPILFHNPGSASLSATYTEMVENTPSLPGKVHAKCPLSHWASFLLLHYHLGEIALGLAIHFLFDTISPGSSASIGHPLRKKQKWSIQCTHKGEFEFDDGISLSFCPLCGSGRDSNLFYVFSIYKHAGFRLFSASASLGQKFAPEWTRGDNFFETEKHNKAFHIDQRSSGGVLPFDSAD